MWDWIFYLLLQIITRFVMSWHTPLFKDKKNEKD